MYPMFPPLASSVVLILRCFVEDTVICIKSLCIFCTEEREVDVVNKAALMYAFLGENLG